MKWLFWNVDFDALQPRRDSDAIIATVVEFGRLVDVQWLLRVYGKERIHTFFLSVGSPEISDKTIAFWRAVFRAQEETWPRPTAWRQSKSGPWVE